ncbi:hypothetical protein CKALI_11250 [Corynebacterium kalinowskii]|uniref:DUF2744 domain-containing protein n=1 Tax=Corynebacterium kalinowskii TaxID=2675216 RepID=A0A6B8VNU7_9CORY|nr:DUF2744 domain-containing protein [Corynebacterium kalinowskii]QGU03094.1 hypothetical protein CKALI_11250 [Corynebacterium kalinowskii]
MPIPLQHHCNSSDPEEAALWALVALPGVGDTAPLALPVEVMRKWAKRLWDCGFRHVPELQTIKYVPPGADADWLTGAGGRWAPIDEAVEPRGLAPDTSQLSMVERQALYAQLRAEFEVPTPDSKHATVEVKEQ